ncbi:MAG TPA: Gldg family protein [Candidatus Acidoferrales bacterium]|nr:Gldg family protein [Candidatus Acidoferrales bacterium]
MKDNAAFFSFSTAAWFGGALASAGLIRYAYYNELTTKDKAILITGGVLLLVAVVGNFKEIIAFFGSKGGRLGTNTVVLVLAVLVILGALNFVGFKHSKRWDLTPEQLYTLSDETKKVVGGLKQDVKVLRFDKASGGDALAETMTEYGKLSPHLSYQFIDPQEQPGIARQYGVRRMGEVLVVSGARTEHLKDTDEQSLTGAILKVTQERQKTVCFVIGHGEKNLTASDGEGYSGVQRGLEAENYVVKPVDLVQAKQTPAECDVVVVAGPKTGYFSEETDALKKYLDAGGKILLLLDPATDAKLEPLLAEWNIALANDLALDVSGAGQMFGLGAAVPVVMQYGTHPITETLVGRRTFFPIARTVGAADKKSVQNPVTDLLQTSDRSFAKNNWDEKQKELRYDEAKDKRGPLTLGVAEERKTDSKPARLVVIGNSAFAANAYMGLQSNGDLFENAVNWLAQDESLISIRPKPRTNRRITFTQAQERIFYFFSLAILPGAVLVTGLVVWLKRR